ncbi:hypothetical protein, partial [Streptomyces halstedii]|uniref:hypothetical protein n=1 Tax=Streptomyces halstedii TaxID=1944 RepID=UPI003360FE48
STVEYPHPHEQSNRHTGYAPPANVTKIVLRALSVLVVVTSMGTFSVPSGALWALAAACAADQSVLMYQGYCRR